MPIRRRHTQHVRFRNWRHLLKVWYKWMYSGILLWSMRIESKSIVLSCYVRYGSRSNGQYRYTPVRSQSWIWECGGIKRILHFFVLHFYLWQHLFSRASVYVCFGVQSHQARDPPFFSMMFFKTATHYLSSTLFSFAHFLFWRLDQSRSLWLCVVDSLIF